MAEDMAGADSPPQGGPAPTPPDASAVSSSPQAGGGTLAPQGAPGSQQIPALGQQAMARAKGRVVVNILHREMFPAFELNSEEGKAVHKALAALSIFAGGGEKDGQEKNSAMASLMQRAMAARQSGGSGGQGAPQPNRGPIPTLAGTQ
jgi:hypothetical protein